MKLQHWLAKIRLVGERTDLHERASHRQMFVDLAALAIAVQDRGALPFAQDGLLTGYRSLVGDYLRQRARGVLLPRGLRLGVLDFTPILQLAKAFDLGEVAKLDIVALPKGRRQLTDHFLGLIGIDAGTGEPAAFKTLFGFRIEDYAAFLAGLRSTDAIAYTMLLAHEFKLASERLQDPGLFLWVERGATLAELARLVDIVRHLDGRPASIEDVRTALRAQKRPSRKFSAAEKRCIERTGPLIEQMGYGVEALRALFLGDGAGPALVAAPDWRVASQGSQIEAVSRCALFAKNTPMIVPGFRARPKRFVRGRRRSAYSYYGVSLDMLLVVGIKDLATACAQPGGVQALTSLAEEIAGGLMTSGTYKGSLCSQRDACNAAVHAELYLRERGHGGAGARFDWQGWFDTGLDDAFYGRLWTRFIKSNCAHGAGSVHGQIDPLLRALEPLLGGHCMPSVDVDPSLAGRVMSQLACGLTPWSMDPMFAALLERSLIERGCRVGMRGDPARARSGAKRSFLLAVLRSSAVRRTYCRFEDVHGCLNHVPDAPCPQMVAAQRTLPVHLRRAAN